MLENIYLVRHGFRANWDDPSIDSGPTGAFHDPPLSTHGLTQASRLATYLSPLLSSSPSSTTSTVLFSSPFYRCLQTLAPLANSTSLPIHIEPGVGEWFSPSPPQCGLHARPPPPEGLQPHIDATLVPLEEYAPTLWPTRRGETIPQFRRRCEEFTSVWVARVEAEMPEVKTAVVVGHAASVIGIGRALLGSDTHDVLSPVASVSLYRRAGLPLGEYSVVETQRSDDAWTAAGGDAGPGGWVQLLNGYTVHLPGGAERAWTFREAALEADGSVIDDPGDGEPWTEADLGPEGLAEGMEKYLPP